MAEWVCLIVVSESFELNPTACNKWQELAVYLLQGWYIRWRFSYKASVHQLRRDGIYVVCAM